MQHHLYSALLAKAAEMNSEDSFPTLYLDSSYSRHLNREGLYIAAETIERRAQASASVSTKRGTARSEAASAGKNLAGAAV